MYLQGMGDYYNDDELVVFDSGGEIVPSAFPVYDPAPMPTYPTPTLPAGTEWTALFNTAITTYGNWKTAEARTEAEVARIQRQAATPPLPGYYPGYPPGYSPFPGRTPGYPVSGGTFMGLTPTTLLLLAAAGVAAVMLSNK